MFRWSVLFWIAVGGATAWCGWAFIGYGVSASYHPMAAKGDLLHPLRMMAIVGVIATAVGMYFVGMRRGPLASRTYQIGLLVLVTIAVVPILPRIDSGYTQSYFLNDQLHEIPWQYSPSNGSEDAGGRSFYVRVSLPEMGQDYGALSRTISIGKATDVDAGRGGDVADGNCVTERATTRCAWQRGGYFYTASGDADKFPEDAAGLMTSAADLLDGFEVSAP